MTDAIVRSPLSAGLSLAAAVDELDQALGTIRPTALELHSRGPARPSNGPVAMAKPQREIDAEGWWGPTGTPIPTDTAVRRTPMTVPAHRRTPMPALIDWFEDFPFGPRTRFGDGEHAIRVEEFQEKGTYTVKAELPGINPDKDVEIMVDHGILTVHAERTEEKKEGKRSEFLYGSFTRSVQLPEGVKEDDIKARYDNGVLTVTAPAGPAVESPRKIPIGKGS
ncbi:Hsp20/alpha crystallin family protein [Catenulispora subtropica]|uniref:SHSP domain-containing protein n=1 Tax=Catenulispora subtropica TaxID=450798 RepID=A0ABN2TEQ6_9ACTN